MSEIKLKPCPFCGGVAELIIDKQIVLRSLERCATVRCTKCGCRTDSYLLESMHDKCERVINAWNRRA